jgi:hypothetical protein
LDSKSIPKKEGLSRMMTLPHSRQVTANNRQIYEQKSIDRLWRLARTQP